MELAPKGIDFTAQNDTSDGATCCDTGKETAEWETAIGKEEAKNAASSQNN